MVAVTINLPDQHAEEIIETYAEAHNYDPATDGDIGAFAKAKLVENIMQVLIAKRAGDASAAAYAAEEALIRQVVVIT